MITFNGQNLKCFATATKAPPNELHVQRNQFAGLIGVSEIVLGVGGRLITIDVLLADASFTTAAAVDAYRAQFDSSIGANGTVQIFQATTNALLHTFGDCTFQGFEIGGSILPAIGGAPQLPNGTFWQRGTLTFFQLTPD